MREPTEAGLAELTEKYLLAEMAQAWSHYRHLEETRTKYLSFFATVVLTAAGFLVTLIKDAGRFDPTHFIGATSVFCLLLFGFSFFILANIARIGFVLAAYDAIIGEARQFMLGADSPACRLWSVRERIPPLVSTGIFGIQAAAIAIVQIVCLLLAGVEGYMGWLVLSGRVNAPRWQGWIMVALVLAALLLMLAFSMRLNRARAIGLKGAVLPASAASSVSNTS